jgi:hypothetical protein
LLVRIGSHEYDPGPEIKKHMLEERLNEIMTGNKALALKEKIDLASELI